MENVLGFLSINFYALLVIIAVAILFFNKPRLKKMEDNLYSLFLLANIFMSCSGILLGIYVSSKVTSSVFVVSLFNKLYLIGLLLWVFIFTFYILYVSLKKQDKLRQIENIFYILGIFSILVVLIFPIEVTINPNSAATSKGISVMYTYFIFGLGLITQIVCVLLNYKNIKSKKYIPVYVLVILGISILIVMIIDPTLNYLINPVLIFIAFIMYHTIENPDVKVIETLNENRKLIEKTNEEKLNLLFELQQKTKEPIKNIQDISNLMISENNKDNLKEMAKQVNISSKELMLLANNVFDISNMDISNIKLALGFYDVKLLFKEIEKRVKEEIQGDVELRTNYTDLIDAKLYGDKVKLKQVLISILNNSLKQTKKGFIEIKVNSIVKYDVCRLIISISDSGCGIGVEEVNRILSASYMEQEDFKKLDKVDVGIEMANKIIKVLGGTLIVRSEINKGSEYLIIIDQKIKENKDKINFNQIDTRGKRKILIVNEKLNEAKQMEEQLIKLGIDVTMVLYGKGAIEKIKNGEEYDMIIVDDEMGLQSGYDTLKKLQATKKFKTPVLITINDDKKFLVSKYIEDGFKDYILKSNLNEEIKKVNKYL